jgi:hypothetical protein
MSPHSLKYPRAVAAEALCRAPPKQGYPPRRSRRGERRRTAGLRGDLKETCAPTRRIDPIATKAGGRSRRIDGLPTASTIAA